MNFDSNVYVVGAVDNRASRIIRIVHISDTMGCEENIISKIPYGHILIHTGDFGKKPRFLSNILWRSRSLIPQIDAMNRFFGKLPHPHKIYAPCGSSDSLLTNLSSDYVQSLLNNVTYLNNSSIELYSLKFYSSTSLNSSNFQLLNNPVGCYSRARRKLQQSTSELSDKNAFNLQDLSLRQIPDDVDVFIAKDSPWNTELYYQLTQRIKPMLYLYGKSDSSYGVQFKDNIVYSNSSFRSYCKDEKKSQLEASRSGNSKANSYHDYSCTTGHSSRDSYEYYSNYYRQRSRYCNAYISNSDPLNSYWNGLDRGNGWNNSNYNLQITSSHCFSLNGRRWRRHSNNGNLYYHGDNSLVQSYQPMVFDAYAVPNENDNDSLPSTKPFNQKQVDNLIDPAGFYNDRSGVLLDSHLSSSFGSLSNHGEEQHVIDDDVNSDEVDEEEEDKEGNGREDVKQSRHSPHVDVKLTA